jgi:nucleotide-binding universal stress UspA family protein
MIPAIKKILYSTDLSRNSAYAFHYAVDLAQWRNAKIIILHAIEPMPPYVYSIGQETLLKTQHEHVDMAISEIRSRLKTFCERFDTRTDTHCLDLVSDILVQIGHPVEEILKAADEQNCDLIVLGTHGKGILLQTFLGSVARSVLDRTRKPVFIVPLPSEKTDIHWDDL